MSGPEGSSNKHCIVCAVGIFCPEHSTLYAIKSIGLTGAFFYVNLFAKHWPRSPKLYDLQKFFGDAAGSMPVSFEYGCCAGAFCDRMKCSQRRGWT